ncbi:hypothetical protein [uncultured Roseibium sp.]|uniref:hypothetical protein n=1 Tax=uncultured Roseibium sp. TaxID=1936171 RepID=UPI003217EC9D
MLLFAGFLLLAAFGAKTYLDRQKELDGLIAAYNLTDPEAAAFRTCVSQMSGKSLTIKSPIGSSKYTQIPKEICACQAVEIAQTLKLEHLDKHKDVIKAYIRSKETPNEFLSEDLLDESDSPRQAFRSLAKSLDNCISEYEDARFKAAAELLKNKL